VFFFGMMGVLVSLLLIPSALSRWRNPGRTHSDRGWIAMSEQLLIGTNPNRRLPPPLLGLVLGSAFLICGVVTMVSSIWIG
jgi:hypothetical protein